MQRIGSIDRSLLTQNNPTDFLSGTGRMEMEALAARVIMSTKAPYTSDGGRLDVLDSWTIVLNGECKTEQDFLVLVGNEVCRPPLDVRVHLVSRVGEPGSAAGRISFVGCTPEYGPDDAGSGELAELTIPTDPQRMRDLIQLVGIPGTRFDLWWTVVPTLISPSNTMYFDLDRCTAGRVMDFTISAVLSAGCGGGG